MSLNRSVKIEFDAVDTLEAIIEKCGTDAVCKYIEDDIYNYVTLDKVLSQYNVNDILSQLSQDAIEQYYLKNFTSLGKVMNE